ncbi:MAG: oligosaccharide flippase family protein [Acidobacteriota bacterium]|nr:oligosaccharide flippase family protein [Acidobacteriota bacterium]
MGEGAGVFEHWAASKRKALLPSGSLRARFALGAFWSLAGATLSRGSLLAASVVCARLLGEAGFGALGMIQSTVGMFGVFAGLGLGLTATKYVAEFRRSDPEHAGRILRLSATAAFCAGLAMAAALILAASFLSRTVLAAPSLAEPLTLGAGLVFFGAINGAQTGALAGFEAFATIARVNLWSGVLSFPLIALGVLSDGLAGAVIGMVAALGVTWLLNQRALARECSLAGVPRMTEGCGREWPILHQFSLPAFLASVIVAPGLWLSSALLVRQPHGYAQLGLYTAADKWRLLILFVPTSVSTTTLPVLASLYGEGDGRGFRGVFRANLLVNTGLALVAALLVSLFASPILAIYGHGFRQGGAVLVVLAFAALPGALNTVLGQPLVAARAMWWRLAFDLVLVGSLVGLAWILIPRYGALGLASAYGLAFSITSLGLFLFLCVTRRKSCWGVVA